ncbi:hypothetical protein CLV39_0797 [Hydrogenothermus marinus]|uniref:Uncharacterized protein n=1 Tax=Hydrogenothermus marinus TaxID=133270 RepID=A0A3M0C2H3_9AQUI|nr:hypothetical protein CLV39_0797 [Hydrogenothermus marinus]
MLNKIYQWYEAGIKYTLIVIPIILFIVMAYLYVKSS